MKTYGSNQLIVFVSFEFLSQLRRLAKRNKCTTADIMRLTMKVGVTAMENAPNHPAERVAASLDVCRGINLEAVPSAVQALEMMSNFAACPDARKHAKAELKNLRDWS